MRKKRVEIIKNRIVYEILSIAIVFILRVGLGADIVSADDSQNLSMTLSAHDVILKHNSEELYYTNTAFSVSFPSEEILPEDFINELNSYKEMYPSDGVDFYTEELYMESEYENESFKPYEYIEKSGVSVGEEIEYEKRICRFKMIKSYKIFKSCADDAKEDKEILKVLDYTYLSPVYQIFVDKVSPTVKHTNDALNGHITTLESVLFEINDETGISEVTLYKNGRQIDSVSLISEKRIVEYEYEVYLTKENDGADNICIEVKDLAGNIEKLECSYIIDDRAPDLTISGVENGDVYDGKAEVMVSISDESGTGFLYYKCVYTDNNLNESSLMNETLKIENNNPVRFSYDKEGIYDITVFSYDESGNYSDVYITSFGVDSESPVVLFENVENEKVYNCDVTLGAIVNELFFDGLNVEIKGEISDEASTRNLILSEYETGAIHNKNIYTFRQDGRYVLSLKATDATGHISNGTCVFTIDKIPPVPDITIGEKTEDEMQGSKVFDHIPQIRIRAKDTLSEYDLSASLYRHENEGAYKEVENCRVISVGRSTDCTMDVPGEGRYVLQADFNDRAGNTSRKRIEFTVDETPPIIGYIDDFNEKYLKYFTLPEQLNNHIKDMTGVKYKAYINSKEIGSADITKDGKYIVQIVAQDEALNTSEKSAAFIIDNTLPRVIVSGIDNNGEVIKDEVIKLSLLDEDDYFKSAYINGNRLDLNDNRQILVSADEYGEYNISVVAADFAGNEVTEEIKMSCNLSSNPFSVKINKSDIQTLTKNDEEIRETFFNRIDVVKFAVIVGIIVATGVIFAVITFVDRDEDRG